MSGWRRPAFRVELAGIAPTVTTFLTAWQPGQTYPAASMTVNVDTGRGVGDRLPQHVFLGTHIVVRQSVAPLLVQP